MRVPRAVVFDLDGTLADTKRDIAAACNHALTLASRAPLSVDVIAGFVGDGARSLVSRAFGLPIDDPETARAFAAFNVFYTAHAADLSSWMPGAREALDACDALAIPLALSTNKPRTATLPLLDALGMRERFKVIYAGGDGPLKPDKTAIDQAIAPLGVLARDAWVVGDGPQDVGAGRAAGAFTVAVLGGFASEASLRHAQPDVVIASLTELPRLLRETATPTA